MSRNPPSIILTEDKDFGEWIYAHHINQVSVIFLRYDFSDTEKMIAIMNDLLSKGLEQFHSKFTTVTTQKIRIRNI